MMLMLYDEKGSGPNRRTKAKYEAEQNEVDYREQVGFTGEDV